MGADNQWAVSVSDIHGWFVALHHCETRGEFARKTEPLGLWLRDNARCVAERIPATWIVVGIVPTSEEASVLLDRFQAEMDR